MQKDFFWIADEGDFMSNAGSFDTDLSWSTVTANRDLKVVRVPTSNAFAKFNDSGAHLTNMAFMTKLEVKTCHMKTMKILTWRI